MRVSIGLKAHSGWAALVVAGWVEGAPAAVERRRIELVEDAWARQPYHAAEGLPPKRARRLVERGVEAARRLAVREMRAALERQRVHDVAACAVLVGAPMPDWSVEEILAVHFRMHKAEGALFQDALVRASRACRLETVAIPEKELPRQAARALGAPADGIVETIARLGRSLRPPWGKDQKDATLAALTALRGGTA